MIVKFKDLSGALKIATLVAWITGGMFVILFFVGFFIGLFGA